MPRKAFLEITNVCNLRCSFCPGTGRKPAFMPFSVFEAILLKLEGYAEYLYFHLMGEPLLHPDLLRMIARAKELGFRPMLTTNGTLLGSCGEALASGSVYKVSISMHAFYDGTLHFAKGTDRGPTLEDYCLPCFRFAKRAAENGTIAVFRLWNLEDGVCDGRNEAVLALLHEAFPGEWRKNRSGFCLSERIFLEWGERFSWPDPLEPDYGKGGFCYGLRDQIGILCDGTVVPCCLDRNGLMALGNLKDSSLADIVSSERAKRIYDGFTGRCAEEELCRHCGYRARFR